jgi:hypothetical protein
MKPRDGTVLPVQGHDEGFTLTELVTIVAVLLLLGSALLSAVGGPGDNGRRTICFNNLRQLGMASAMYPNDNRDFMAWPNWDGGSSPVYPGWLYTVTNNTIPDPGTAGTNVQAVYTSGSWFQYVREPRAYLCPVDVQSSTFALRKDRLSSYVMNGAVCG